MRINTWHAILVLLFRNDVVWTGSFCIPFQVLYEKIVRSVVIASVSEYTLCRNILY